MILLARHGETDYNAPPRRIQGQRDIPLNDHGREQARVLAEEASKHPVETLWSSHLSRARETAAIVGEVLGLEAREDPRLAEANWGDWQGRLADDIARDAAELWDHWKDSLPQWRFPGGESLQEHMDRTWAALDDIAAEGRTALVVCHGGTIRCALARHEPGGIAAVGPRQIPNGALIPLP